MANENLYWYFDDDTFSRMDNDRSHDADTDRLLDNGIVCDREADVMIFYSRFENGFEDLLDCPWCRKDVDQFYDNAKRGWRCDGCGEEFTEFTGTYAADAKLERHKWCRLAWLICEMETWRVFFIARDLGLTYEKTREVLRAVTLALKDAGLYNKKYGRMELLDAVFTVKRVKRKSPKKKEVVLVDSVLVKEEKVDVVSSPEKDAGLCTVVVSESTMELLKDDEYWEGRIRDYWKSKERVVIPVEDWIKEKVGKPDSGGKFTTMQEYMAEPRLYDAEK